MGSNVNTKGKAYTNSKIGKPVQNEVVQPKIMPPSSNPAKDIFTISKPPSIVSTQQILNNPPVQPIVVPNVQQAPIPPKMLTSLSKKDTLNEEFKETKTQKSPVADTKMVFKCEKRVIFNTYCIMKVDTAIGIYYFNNMQSVLQELIKSNITNAWISSFDMYQWIYADTNTKLGNFFSDIEVYYEAYLHDQSINKINVNGMLCVMFDTTVAKHQTAIVADKINNIREIKRVRSHLDREQVTYYLIAPQDRFDAIYSQIKAMSEQSEAIVSAQTILPPSHEFYSHYDEIKSNVIEIFKADIIVIDDQQIVLKTTSKEMQGEAINYINDCILQYSSQQEIMPSEDDKKKPPVNILLTPILPKPENEILVTKEKYNVDRSKEKQYPSYWERIDELDNHDPLIIKLNKANHIEEWKRVESAFHSSMPTIEITKIKRIQSKSKWLVYRRESIAIGNLLNSNSSNERHLFIGIEGKKPSKIYKTLDNNEYMLDSQGKYGKGLYMHTRASTASATAYMREWSNEKKILFANIILGDVADKGSSQGGEEMPINEQKARRYNSITDNYINPTLFFIKHHEQIYIEYEIAFQDDELN